MSPARTRAVAAVAAACLGLVAFTGPATAAASSDSPVVAFIDAGVASTDHALSVSAPDGSSRTRLTASNVETRSFDVSADGSTMLVGAYVGGTGNDTSWGLVLVRRNGSTTTRLLSTDWDTQPVLSANGSTAWWLLGGYLYTDTAGVTSRSKTPLFAVDGQPYGFAVSPDGKQAAVSYFVDSGDEHVGGGVLARPISGAGPRFTKTYDSAAVLPYPWNLAWVDDGTLLYAEQTDAHLTNLTTTLSADGTSGVVDSGAPGEYMLRKVGDTWWHWRESGSPDEVTSFGTSAAPFTEPTTWTPRSDGQTTYSYRAAAARPPVLTTATNRAVAHPHLYVSATITTTGRKVAYDAWNAYLAPIPGLSYDADSSWNGRGVLQYSYDNGRTYRTAGWTTGNKPVAWPGSQGASTGTGYTRALTRNTRFRWHYVGDVFTSGGYSPSRLVGVRPTITLKVRRSGSYRTVSGHAARTGGTAVLYKVAKNGHRTRVGTVRISAKGDFSFGKRRLAHGSYLVATLRTASWAAGGKRLTL